MSHKQNMGVQFSSGAAADTGPILPLSPAHFQPPGLNPRCTEPGHVIYINRYK